MSAEPGEKSVMGCSDRNGISVFRFMHVYEGKFEKRSMHFFPLTLRDVGSLLLISKP